MDKQPRAPALSERLARLEAARAIMQAIRAEGMTLWVTSDGKRLGFRPKGLMTTEVFRQLRAHGRLVLLLLSMVEREIPPDAAPGIHERCILCGACRWVNPTCWCCGACHALWRPLPMRVTAGAAPVTARSAGTIEQERAAVAAGSA